MQTKAKGNIDACISFRLNAIGLNLQWGEGLISTDIFTVRPTSVPNLFKLLVSDSSNCKSSNLKVVEDII